MVEENKNRINQFAEKWYPESREHKAFTVVKYNEKNAVPGSGMHSYSQLSKGFGAFNFYNKLHHLQHQAALNERVKEQCAHSLSFHESDKFNKEKLCAIAETYMIEIGFNKTTIPGLQTS